MVLKLLKNNHFEKKKLLKKKKHFLGIWFGQDRDGEMFGFVKA